MSHVLFLDDFRGAWAFLSGRSCGLERRTTLTRFMPPMGHSFSCQTGLQKVRSNS